MYLRFLRLGARICGFGSLLSVVLIPIYASGRARGLSTTQFNLLTLARVQSGSTWRVWVTVFCWWIFIAFVLREFWIEWTLYYKNKSAFAARGDEDIPKECRYTVRCEQIGQNTDDRLQEYFNRLFPDQVVDTAACIDTSKIDACIQKREKLLVKVESLVAKTHANPDKPRPLVRVKGEKVDAIDHLMKEIERMNTEVDVARSGVIKESSTAFVTFKTLRTKQAAIQCELTGDPDSIVAFPSADPKSTIWENVYVPIQRQKMSQFLLSLLWCAGILFWAVPVTFVTAIANLNSILKSFKLPAVDETTFWYGLVSGLLPVIFLAILMAVLYMAIEAGAKRIIRLKTMPEVDSYTLYWHMLFQFANLWLILIGGSLFNQIDQVLSSDEGESKSETQAILDFLDVIATALPGASTFFMNMIIVASFGAFGMELSMIPTYATTLIFRILSPEAARTQRQIDDAKTPPSIVWGQQIPPIIFIFLVSFLYMPIVPLIEVFGLAYFAGSFVVWKHQCLHVYAQEFEGGGEATWQKVFGFLMACLYIGEGVFISFMGIKQAPIQAALGFVPLVVTGYVHRTLNRKFIAPTQNLSLEAAATADIKDGDFIDYQEGAYRQPAADAENDEREPMPYRREPKQDEFPPEGAV